MKGVKPSRRRNDRALGSGFFDEQLIPGNQYGGGFRCQKIPQVPVACIRRWLIALNRGIAPDSIGGEFNQDLFHFRLLKAVKPGNSGPQQNMAVLIEKIRGKKINQAAGKHGIQNLCRGAVGTAGDESGHQHIGIDDENSGIHPETRWALVSSTASRRG
jgi:hypothetical protein